ncbi:MAG: APC family permease [Haloechinothrix sp.]
MSTPSATTQGRLTKNALGAPGIVFLVLAAVAPLTAMIVIAPLGIALGNGGGMPGSFLFAAIVLLLFAVGYARMSRHVVNAGAFYAYVTRAMGRTAGLVTAFVALVGYNSFVTGAVVVSGVFTGAVVGDVLHVDLPWQLWSAASVLAVLILGRRGVGVSAKVLGVSLILETLILVVLDVSILFTEGFDLTAFDPGIVLGAGAGLGFLFAFNAFLGFEATAIFAEEAREPHRTIPRATYAAIAIIGLFYTITTLAVVSSLGVAKSGAAAQADTAGLLFAVSHQHLGGFLTDVMQMLLVVSLFAALLALHNSATRYIFAMGRARVLPEVLGRTHHRMGSPHVASAVQMGLSATLVAAFVAVGADPILVTVPTMTGFGTLGIIALQAAAAVAVVVFFRKRRDRRYLSTLVAPALGGAGLIVAFVMAVANFSTIAGSDSPVITRLPWLLLATVIAAVAVAGYLRRRRPEIYDKLGSDFVTGDERPNLDQASAVNALE